MNTDNRTNEPTAEQIVRATLLRCQFDTLGDKVADVVKDLRANGLLSEGTPSEKQARAIRKLDNVQAILAGAQASVTDAVRELSLTSAALTAAGVAPQEPNQNETKSGNNFVSLDPEKVADVLNDHDYMYSTSACKCLWTGPGSHQAHQSEALCEAYTEGKLTK